jgi:hypothetical protein
MKSRKNKSSDKQRSLKYWFTRKKTVNSTIMFQKIRKF